VRRTQLRVFFACKAVVDHAEDDKTPSVGYAGFLR
jgi:hypothetical protein